MKKVSINTAQLKGRLPIRVKNIGQGIVEAVIDQVSTAALLTSSGIHMTVEAAADLLNGTGIEGLQIIDESERNDSSWEAPTF